MPQIVIGKSSGHNVSIDLGRLIATRLLIQANSGGGKSWLLRRLAEQLVGKVPVIIIDPEGEFATLREKFDYFLIGDGGDAPAHVRSAGLLAETLLKMRACAVCDLYETFRKTPGERHEWVKNFIGGLLDAPKSLWGETVIIVDEAHMFAPEQGESASEGVMIGLATAGRKRGFCPIWATQRLALVNKSASSQLQNRMVGLTFEDVDVKRAVELLSIAKEDVHGFKAEVKVLEPGQFFAFGRAISKERILVKVGDVETSHPKIGKLARNSAPPPAPEKIMALLPKLADLPKTAEEKARTESDLRGEIRDLRRQLTAVNKNSQVQTKVVTDEKVIIRAVRKETERCADYIYRVLGKRQSRMLGIIERASAILGEIKQIDLEMSIPQVSGGEIQQRSSARADTLAGKPPAPQPPRPITHSTPENGLSRPVQRVLAALAEFEAIGRTQGVSRASVASWCGVKASTGSFKNYLRQLRVAAMIEDVNGDQLRLTDVGRAAAPPVDAPVDTDGLLARAAAIFGSTGAKLLRLVHGKYPEYADRQWLADELGISPETGSFKNYLSELRSAGLITDGQNKQVRAAEWMFID